MAPAAALPKEQPEDSGPIGINAVLLGPPGSGKGTQVTNHDKIDYVNTTCAIEPCTNDDGMIVAGTVVEEKILCVPFINR